MTMDGLPQHRETTPGVVVQFFPKMTDTLETSRAAYTFAMLVGDFADLLPQWRTMKFLFDVDANSADDRITPELRAILLLHPPQSVGRFMNILSYFRDHPAGAPV